MVHGAGMEDGIAQGYLQLVGIPYVSNNVYSSVVCQDKEFFKELLEYHNIPTVKYVWFFDNEYYLFPNAYELKDASLDDIIRSNKEARDLVKALFK